MSDYSDPGYGYLAEHLASQGYIAVSVDENFLNGLFFFDGNMEEMPLKGWLLLQHLAQWQQWNDLSGNPFSNKVDMERIALIGHSRGGEAVAWAALPAYLVKASWLTGLHGFPGKMTPEEIVLQTHTLPLAAFQTVSPTINLSNLQTIRFLFDGTTTGAIYLDKIGFSEQTR